MEEKTSIPYIVYESEQARSERHIKRLILALMISVVLIFTSNALWLYAWLQYDYSSEATTTTTHQIDVDAEDGIANYIGNNGEIVNGKDYSNQNNNEENNSKENEIGE